MRTLRPVLLMAFIALLLMGGPANASGGFVLKEHGFYILDFVILSLFLGYFIKKPAKNFLLQRHEDVKKEMGEATALKSRAEERVQKYEGLLATLDEEVSKLQEQFKEDGARIEAEIRQHHEAASERVRQESARSLARDAAQMKTNIELDLVVRALDRADVLIKEQMNDANKRVLLEAFIRDLEQRDNLDATAIRT